MRSEFFRWASVGVRVGVAFLPALLACDNNPADSVAPKPVASITISTNGSPPGLVQAGEPTPLVVVARDADGNPLSGHNFLFASSDESVARIGAPGVVTGGTVGVATVTASTEGIVGSLKLTVVPGPASQLVVDPALVAVFPKTSAQLSASVKDKVGNVIPGARIMWSTSNTSAITVDSSGIIRGVAPSGTATITASSSGVSGTSATRIIVAKQIAAGSSFSCFLDGDGIVYCWGTNVNLETGTGITSSSPVLRPTQVATAARFQSITVGGSHACGLTGTGTAYCWGSNIRGSVGDGTNVNRAVPVAVSTTAEFVRIVAGWDHTCAQTASGDMYCWGGFNYTNTPTKSFTSALFDSLYAGADATCGANAGSLSCWGSNQFGELASGDKIGSLTPRPVAGDLTFVQVEGYSDQICGLATDRSVYCWGFAWNSTTPRLLTSNVPFAKFTFGHGQYCGIDAGQVAYCYGSNEDGKLGIGSVLATYVDRPTRVQPPENGETNFSEISAGGYQTCAIGLSGAIYCWGRGEEIGIGVQENRVSPTLVSPPR